MVLGIWLAWEWIQGIMGIVIGYLYGNECGVLG